MDQVFFSMCKSADTPISLSCWLLFKHGEHLQLAKKSIVPTDYPDHRAFAVDYCIVSFLSKWKGLKTGLNLEDEAIKKFTTSEARCKSTNEAIRRARNEGFNSFTESVIFTAQRKIARLLDDIDMDLMSAGFGWGPGSTADLKLREAFVDTKMCKQPISVTSHAQRLAEFVIRDDLRWLSCLDNSMPLTYVKEHCVIETVPKSSTTHRTIAKEARMNGFLQKGVGFYLRRKLKRVGIDLDDQSNNQHGALLAYTEELSTIDLKSASDTVSKELVFELFPPQWAFLLDDLRSKKALLPDGSEIVLEKFSSMGNGFTFELETLIFWAIATSVRDLLGEVGEILVYGDDIICPRAVARKLLETLEILGFDHNESKTFIDGPFFESCGRHYFHGYDVTPIYQKEEVVENEELLRMANRLLRAAYRFANSEIQSGFLCKARDATIRKAPRHFLRYQLPFGVEGDDGWLALADEFVRVPFDINLGFRCRVLRLNVPRFPANDEALLALALRKGSGSEPPLLGWSSADPLTTRKALTII